MNVRLDVSIYKQNLNLASDNSNNMHNKHDLNHNKNTISLFYDNQMHFNYIKDFKKELKNIIHRQ